MRNADTDQHPHEAAALPSAADFRAIIGRHRILIYRLAAVVGLSPNRLSLVLNERSPLTPALAARLKAALVETDEPEG